MALPPDIQKRKIRERLIGLTGRARLTEIKKILEELPGYNNGPYGEMRKGLLEEIEKTKTKSKIKHQDWIGVPRQGDRQFVLVGKPSAGKSSLLSKLSGMQIKCAAYSFTTLKPIPAVVTLNGAHIQVVDLPGLIEGASEDKGGGRRLLGIVKNSDGILLMVDLSKPLEEFEPIIRELKRSEINKPLIVIGNKIDVKGARQRLVRLKKKFPDQEVIALSTETQEGFERLKQRMWSSTNLIRVYTKGEGTPLMLDRGSTVHDFVSKVHKKLLEEFKEATLNGPSAKFSNQKVGLQHVLEDEDSVEIKTN
jgi:small GTP-binding protein